MQESPQSSRFVRLAKFAAAAAVALSVASLLGSSAHSQQPDAKQAAAEAAARGKKQFAQSCGFCHGPDATGARGPDLVRSTILAHDVTGNLIGEVIKNGRPDKGMPPLPATEDQIADIAAYLHARAKEALQSSGVPAAYPVEKLLTGSLEKGKAFFEGAGGCKNCHSPDGDLAGVAKKYSSIESKRTCSIQISSRLPPPSLCPTVKKSPASFLISTISWYPSASATNPAGIAPSLATPSRSS